ncbi:MAG: DNA replication/repair protein RecF, partial [Rhodoluna sp.]
IGYINTVSFTPDDSRIVHDDPADRREFIDQLLIQFTPRLAGVFADYDRVLKQRNSLLKTSRNLPKDSPGFSTLEVWDESLFALGSEIIFERINLAKKLSPHVAKIYKQISQDDRIAQVSVLSTVFNRGTDFDSLGEVAEVDRESIAESFRQKLVELRSKELERGLSLVGPQRDDLKLMLGDFPAKGYISYGEAWSFAISLKLAGAELLKAEARAGDPILILDDVFSSLDDNRLDRLLDMVSNYEQVIITDAIRGKQATFDDAARFLISDGKVVEIQ